MRDFTGIAFALGLAIMVALVAVVLRPILRKIGVVGDRGVLESGTNEVAPVSVRKPVSTLCVVCKKKDAELRAYKWVRDDGVVDLVRRFFGAPATFRIGRDPWGDNVCCGTCDPMALARFKRHHAMDLAKDADFRTKRERERARFETVGWVEEVRADVREHENEIAPYRNNVVSIDASEKAG